LKPYRHSGFQNSGEKIRDRFAEADRLEAGGLNPLGGKLNPDFFGFFGHTFAISAT
jgi:hypothetical protein